ncbi:lysosomal-associated transmembrane protein 5 isoform X1 [Apteryx mantelli]|uniref:Lysosomal-associated transmembrane protein 5 isoform X1 n=1 Tax=Apteryx mantelli TaxID=2696672 RepID=A0A8B7JHP1_9AVES|nr:PREDICTED: lysosomal-associated transmembrane protein 5 isoform X1 [Apteryx mantelli mantelli]XP_025932161.1 lysosomal-associated transmembrane protein 5 isoform X2 [Apteryx rowi]
MTAQTTTEPPKCCCFNIKTATVALGIFHMVMSVLLLIEHSLEVASGKGYCKDLDKDYYRIADVITSFLLIIMLFVISFNLLLGVVKKRERLLIPFLALQVMDFLLSLLTMFSSYIQVPAIISVSSVSHTQGLSKIPFLALQLLDFCLSILTLCSSYMEVPTYLSLKASDNGGFLPTLEKLPTEEYAKIMVTFTIAFIAVLFLKAYMFKCVLSCFKYIKASKRGEVKVDSQTAEKGALPSYEEAVESPSKDFPPPYVAI